MKKWLFSLLFLFSILTVSGVVSSPVYCESITDVMRDFSDENKPDEDTMNEYVPIITAKAGTVISVIAYLILAGLSFTTACDLLYIAFPPIRPYLYDGAGHTSGVGSANAHLVGRNETWTGMANNNMNKANMYNNQAQAYAQRAQQQAMMGDTSGARHSANMARLNQDSANRQVRHARDNMGMQQWSDNWRSSHNQDAMARAQHRAEENRRD